MIATATLQTIWDCRWSRPGHRLSGVEDALQPESAWVCVHDGNRRDRCDRDQEPGRHDRCVLDLGGAVVGAAVR